MIRSANSKRLLVAALLVLLAPLGAQLSALVLSAIVALLLAVLAVWELRDRPVTDAHGVRS
jgi:uncharacterized membrane protein YfbV (UPF0208 family)